MILGTIYYLTLYRYSVGKQQQPPVTRKLYIAHLKSQDLECMISSLPT